MKNEHGNTHGAWFAAVLMLATVSSGADTQDSFIVDRPDGRSGQLSAAYEDFEGPDGAIIPSESGTFLVPENRLNPENTALISIPYRKFRATTNTPATPIFLLAGGPGSSWMDRVNHPENFREVQFYRSIADVVLFDQRGGGHSKPRLTCDERRQLPLDQPLDLQQMTAEMREMSIRCRDGWLEAGVDLAGYTTSQNAADIIALKNALGYGKISLVGGSYGSHLALALMHLYPEEIERAVLYGVEGPDHTWDDPAGRLATLQRIAETIETADILQRDIPEQGLIAVLREIIDRIEDAPVSVDVQAGETEAEVVVDAAVVRLLSGFQAGRRSRLTLWPEFLLDMWQGDYSFIARGAVAVRQLGLNTPMHYMMDCASGISDARRARYSQADALDIVGSINLEYETLCEVWDAEDVQYGHHVRMDSEIPTLLIHGTWDTSTPIENAREVAADLSNAQLIEVIRGGHGALYNLYENWPEIYPMLTKFFRGADPGFPAQVKLAPTSSG